MKTQRNYHLNLLHNVQEFELGNMNGDQLQLLQNIKIFKYYTTIEFISGEYKQFLANCTSIEICSCQYGKKSQHARNKSKRKKLRVKVANVYLEVSISIVFTQILIYIHNYKINMIA